MMLEQIISDCIERILWGLINERSVTRHLKIVDTDSGEVAGYSRYIKPDSHTRLWLDAQTAKPSAEEQSEYEKRLKSVSSGGRIRGMNYTIAVEFRNLMEEVENDILKENGP